MLLETLKARITQAVKEKDNVARDILRLAFGEVQTSEARNGRALEDGEVAAVLKKLVKSNEETLALAGEGDRAATLRRENEVLASLLPKTLSPEQIVEALAAQADAIKAAKSDGQAMGVAMKHMKSTGAAVEAADVTAAVKRIRG